VTAEERQARISVRAGDGLIFFSQYYSHVHAQILKSSSAGGILILVFIIYIYIYIYILLLCILKT
jgi:hypothetical protein